MQCPNEVYLPGIQIREYKVRILLVSCDSFARELESDSEACPSLHGTLNRANTRCAACGESGWYSRGLLHFRLAMTALLRPKQFEIGVKPYHITKILSNGKGFLLTES